MKSMWTNVTSDVTHLLDFFCELSSLCSPMFYPPNSPSHGVVVEPPGAHGGDLESLQGAHGRDDGVGRRNGGDDVLHHALNAGGKGEEGW